MRLILRTFYGRFLSPPQKVRRNFISISFIPENQYSILNYSAWRKWRLWRNGGEVSAIPPLPPHIVFIPSRLRLIVRAHWRDKTIESFRKKSGIWSMRELLCYKHFRMGVFFWKKFSRAEGSNYHLKNHIFCSYSCVCQIKIVPLWTIIVCISESHKTNF